MCYVLRLEGFSHIVRPRVRYQPLPGRVHVPSWETLACRKHGPEQALNVLDERQSANASWPDMLLGVSTDRAPSISKLMCLEELEVLIRGMYGMGMCG